VNVVVCLITAVAAYLLGSIPTGYLVGIAKGIDVRKVGSGNIGATNAFRILGKGPGIFVLVADGLKGWVAVALFPLLVHKLFDAATAWDTQTAEWLKIIAAICVILGHNYTCWLKFKGGKGIATSAGVLAALVPLALVISLSTWIIVCLLTRYVSAASIAASLILPLATYVAGYGWLLTAVTGVMCALAVYKHKANISRLMNGTENRLGQKKAPPSTGTAL
jgi:glycerol-3-phosphate acyltransferase PlsY